MNHRHFKLTVRSDESDAAQESMIEQEVRKRVARGALHVNVDVERERGVEDYRINQQVLLGYHQLLSQTTKAHGAPPIEWSTLVTLPGVVEERTTRRQSETELQSAIMAALDEALHHFDSMRAREGKVMADELIELAQDVERRAQSIEKLAPKTVENYRLRVTEKLRNLLAEHGATPEPSVVVREVGLFAERIDIGEELVRLRSHLAQFVTVVGGSDSNGRKLDFLTQEMFREANTMGSKANDAAISNEVVEIKVAIDRMRELVQNVA